jgi:hypothetical protein
MSRDLIEGEFNSILAAPLVLLPSLYHLIRLIQHGLRNRQANLLSGLQVDNQIKLRRLLYWKFPRTRRDGTIRVAL